jgi:hypothetical protein
MINPSSTTDVGYLVHMQECWSFIMAVSQSSIPLAYSNVVIVYNQCYARYHYIIGINAFFKLFFTAGAKDPWFTKVWSRKL